MPRRTLRRYGHSRASLQPRPEEGGIIVSSPRLKRRPRGIRQAVDDEAEAHTSRAGFSFFQDPPVVKIEDEGDEHISYFEEGETVQPEPETVHLSEPKSSLPGSVKRKKELSSTISTSDIIYETICSSEDEDDYLPRQPTRSLHSVSLSSAATTVKVESDDTPELVEVVELPQQSPKGSEQASIASLPVKRPSVKIPKPPSSPRKLTSSNTSDSDIAYEIISSSEDEGDYLPQQPTAVRINEECDSSSLIHLMVQIVDSQQETSKNIEPISNSSQTVKVTSVCEKSDSSPEALHIVESRDEPLKELQHVPISSSSSLSSIVKITSTREKSNSRPKIVESPQDTRTSIQQASIAFSPTKVPSVHEESNSPQELFEQYDYEQEVKLAQERFRLHEKRKKEREEIIRQILTNKVAQPQATTSFDSPEQEVKRVSVDTEKLILMRNNEAEDEEDSWQFPEYFNVKLLNKEVEYYSNNSKAKSNSANFSKYKNESESEDGSESECANESQSELEEGEIRDEPNGADEQRSTTELLAMAAKAHNLSVGELFFFNSDKTQSESFKQLQVDFQRWKEQQRQEDEEAVVKGGKIKNENDDDDDDDEEVGVERIPSEPVNEECDDEEEEQLRSVQISFEEMEARNRAVDAWFEENESKELRVLPEERSVKLPGMAELLNKLPSETMETSQTVLSQLRRRAQWSKWPVMEDPVWQAVVQHHLNHRYTAQGSVVCLCDRCQRVWQKTFSVDRLEMLCIFCNQMLPIKDCSMVLQAYSHLIGHIGPQLRCTHCTIVFPDQQSLQRHLERNNICHPQGEVDKVLDYLFLWLDNYRKMSIHKSNLFIGDFHRWAHLCEVCAMLDSRYGDFPMPSQPSLPRYSAEYDLTHWCQHRGYIRYWCMLCAEKLANDDRPVLDCTQFDYTSAVDLHRAANSRCDAIHDMDRMFSCALQSLQAKDIRDHLSTHHKHTYCRLVNDQIIFQRAMRVERFETQLDQLFGGGVYRYSKEPFQLRKEKIDRILIIMWFTRRKAQPVDVSPYLDEPHDPDSNEPPVLPDDVDELGPHFDTSHYAIPGDVDLSQHLQQARVGLMNREYCPIDKQQVWEVADEKYDHCEPRLITVDLDEAQLRRDGMSLELAIEKVYRKYLQKPFLHQATLDDTDQQKAHNRFWSNIKGAIGEVYSLQVQGKQETVDRLALLRLLLPYRKPLEWDKQEDPLAEFLSYFGPEVAELYGLDEDEEDEDDDDDDGSSAGEANGMRKKPSRKRDFATFDTAHYTGPSARLFTDEKGDFILDENVSSTRRGHACNSTDDYDSDSVRESARFSLIMAPPTIKETTGGRIKQIPFTCRIVEPEKELPLFKPNVKQLQHVEVQTDPVDLDSLLEGQLMGKNAPVRHYDPKTGLFVLDEPIEHRRMPPETLAEEEAQEELEWAGKDVTQSMNGFMSQYFVDMILNDDYEPNKSTPSLPTSMQEYLDAVQEEERAREVARQKHEEQVQREISHEQKQMRDEQLRWQQARPELDRLASLQRFSPDDIDKLRESLANSANPLDHCNDTSKKSNKTRSSNEVMKRKLTTLLSKFLNPNSVKPNLFRAVNSSRSNIISLLKMDKSETDADASDNSDTDSDSKITELRREAVQTAKNYMKMSEMVMVDKVHRLMGRERRIRAMCQQEAQRRSQRARFKTDDDHGSDWYELERSDAESCEEVRLQLERKVQQKLLRSFQPRRTAPKAMRKRGHRQAEFKLQGLPQYLSHRSKPCALEHHDYGRHGQSNSPNSNTSSSSDTSTSTGVSSSSELSTSSHSNPPSTHPSDPRALTGLIDNKSTNSATLSDSGSDFDFCCAEDNLYTSL